MNKETLDRFSPKVMADIIRLEKRLVAIEEEIKLVDEKIKEIEGGNDTEKWI